MFNEGNDEKRDQTKPVTVGIFIKQLLGRTFLNHTFVGTILGYGIHSMHGNYHAGEGSFITT